VLQALEGRLGSHSELKELLVFYREIYRGQFKVRAQLPPSSLGLGPALAKARQDSGRPLLTFDDLALEAEPFYETVVRMTEVVERHNPEWRGVCDAIPAEELLDEALRQFDAPDSHAGDGSVCSMVVALALAPYVQHQAAACRELMDDAGWRQGSCPICGAWPQIAYLDREGGARRLHCGRCDTWWGYDRVRCPFCTEMDGLSYFASDDKIHRLYVCDICKRYVKTVDMRETFLELDPLVERLVTLPMDLAAQEKGYTVQSPVGASTA
jgi:FdhE protein